MKQENTAPTIESILPENRLIVLRTCDKDMKAYGGFIWPSSGYVEAPDFKPTRECGNGLHGLANGEGDWLLMNWNVDAKALLVVTDKAKIVELSGKVKFQSCFVQKVMSLAAAICEVVCDAVKIRKTVSEIQASATSTENSSSGNNSKLASSGNNSTLASSGEGSKLASSGNNSKLASSGNNSTLASSGNYSKLASSGEDSTLASSGNYSTLASSGEGSKLASSGNNSKLASSGEGSKLASSGEGSKLASSGYNSKLASSGEDSTLASSGYNSTVMIAGLNGIASAGKGGAIALAYHDGTRIRIAVAYVGEDGIEADTHYKIVNGKFVKA